MKKFLLILLVTVLMISCEKNEIEIPEIPEATIIGRWQIQGDIEISVQYEFTETKRFTIYKNDDGTYPTLEEFNELNPELTGNDWEYAGDTVVVDLNFGNYSKLVPTFKCNNYIIDWTDEDGAFWGTYLREGYDITECN